MASAYAALGKARRKQSKIARERKIGMEAISSVGEIATFGVGQAKKADTAWDEYETGYKELGGEGFEKPKFGQKGYFKGPEGEVRVGATMYDRGQIQKAGSFLGSDAAAVLDQDTRDKYLQRTAPGREIPTLQKPTQPGATAQVSGVVPTTPQFPTQDYKQTVSRSPSLRISEGGLSIKNLLGGGMIAGGTEPIQESEYGGVDPKPRGRGTGQWLRDLGRQYLTPGKGLAVHTSGERAGEIITDEERYPGGYKPAFARGGDFITNGPQEILVGDNPGGRERVTIRPLDSEDTKGYYGKAHNWLEALYANNERRKKY